jgi:hypothetical protein
VVPGDSGVVPKMKEANEKICFEQTFAGY